MDSDFNMYSHNPVVGSHFGGVYEVVVGQGRPSDHRLMPCQFSDSQCAAQFVRSLDVDEYRWAGILGQCLSHTDPNQHISQRVATLICANGLSFYEIPRLESAPAVQLEHGKGLVFVPAIAGSHRKFDAKKVQTQTPEAAQALVSSLNDKQVHQALVSLEQTPIAQPSGAYGVETLRKGLVAELISGKVSVLEIKQRSATRGESVSSEMEVVSSTNTPGNRKTPLAPEPAQQASPAPQPMQAPASAEADQVQTMEKAAEEGTPFCEECAA